MDTLPKRRNSYYEYCKENHVDFSIYPEDDLRVVVESLFSHVNDNAVVNVDLVRKVLTETVKTHKIGTTNADRKTS